MNFSSDKSLSTFSSSKNLDANNTFDLEFDFALCHDYWWRDCCRYCG